MKWVCGIGLTLWACAAHAQAFSNEAVLALHKAGLGDSAIITKIESLPCAYDVSTDRLIAMKKAGVSDDVLAAMIDRCKGASRAQGVEVVSADPAARHAPGIYLAAEPGGSAGLQLLRPAIASGERTKGNGSVLFPFKVKLVVPRANAQIAAHGRRPTFYFYFDAADRKVSGFGKVSTVSAQSPDEFNLVRFNVRSAVREVDIGRLVGFSAAAGIDPKYTLPFASQELGDGAFKVTPDQPLASGEYAFVLTGEKGRTRIYDFSVVTGIESDPRK